MTSESVLMVDEPVSIPLPKSPVVRINSQPLPTDSMISIALSEPTSEASLDEQDVEAASEESDVTVELVSEPSQRRSSAQLFQGLDLDTDLNGPQENTDEDVTVESSPQAETSQIEAAAAALEGHGRPRRATNASQSSQDSFEDESPVDWAELEKDEESVPKDEASDEVCRFCDHNV